MVIEHSELIIIVYLGLQDKIRPQDMIRHFSWMSSPSWHVLLSTGNLWKLKWGFPFAVGATRDTAPGLWHTVARKKKSNNVLFLHYVFLFSFDIQLWVYIDIKMGGSEKFICDIVIQYSVKI